MTNNYGCNNPSPADDPEENALLQKILTQIQTLPPEDRVIVLRALERYRIEAAKGSYQSEVSGIIDFIRSNDLFADTDSIFDLGAGPGQLVTELAKLYPDTKVDGIDLCPGFIVNFRRKNTLANSTMDVGLIDQPLPVMQKEGRTGAISVLTLDRLVYPKLLIQNMSRCTRSKVIATLLPINPEDDNPSRQGEGKIMYTRDINRIVSGRDDVEDRDALLRLLRKEWDTSVDFTKIPYTVSSSGDRQEYKLGIFYTS